jgi:hypothetical protein
LPAAGFVMPAIVSVAAALPARSQVDPVAVQPVKPLVRATVGELGIVKLDGKRTVTVPPPRGPPLAPDVNPTVQVTFVWFAAEFAPALNVTLVGAPAAAITTLPAGFAAVVSELVLTLKVVLAKVWAAGSVKPAIARVAAVLAASAHVPL